ncbi:MAG TPA: T9SS type A sorting domain-containing protein, partial [Rubricoccaceae bacterium]
PSYWTPSGAGATWPTAQFHSGTHSLALSGAGAASWTQTEVVRNWVSQIGFTGTPPVPALFTVRAWVRTEGVNTAPTTDAAKYQMVLTFRDAAGVIGGGDLVVDLPQAQATTGWTQVVSPEISLERPATSVTAVVRKGASATGTLWIDDFAFVKSDGNTLTSWHGANVDLTSDWYTYWPGFDGSRATPNWVVGKTTAQAHTGAASLRVERLGAPLAGEEAVAISQRVPVTPGRPVVVSYWVKHEGNADPTTIGTGDNNLGLTALWYNNLAGGRNGYGEIGGADIRLNGEYNSQVIPLLPRNAANGWTNYAFVLNPIANTVATEVRLRYWHTFTGVSYWDDIAITNISGANLFNPVAGEDAPAPGAPEASGEQWFRANQPNPFADQTEIRFALPRAEAVTLEVYDLLGRRVALLADDTAMQAGEQTVAFERGQLPSGTYLVVLRTPSHSEARQITVVR